MKVVPSHFRSRKDLLKMKRENFLAALECVM